MKTGYKNYHVNIKDVKYIADDGSISPRTAIVTFYDAEGKEINNELFGVADINGIYDLIKKGKNIVLDNCYISDFSLSAFRRYNNIDKKELVAIKGFSAKNAFFESTICNDFSYASFADGEVSFDGAHFGKGKVSFAGSHFGTGNVIFSNAFFRNGDIEFTGAVFGEGDFMFKNTIVKFCICETYLAVTKLYILEIFYPVIYYNIFKHKISFAKDSAGKFYVTVSEKSIRKNDIPCTKM